MAERKGLILYHSHIDSLKKMPDDLRGILLLALLRYSDTGKAECVPASLEYVYSFMCSEADRDKEKYKKTCAARAEAGRMGGAPAGNRNAAKPQAKQPNACCDKQNKQKVEKQAKQANAEADAEADADAEDIPPTPPGGAPSAQERMFDEFWTAYPKKKNKGDAKKAWKQAKVTKPLFDRIMGSVEAAKKSSDWKKDGGQYIPHPASWLRAEGWEDELPKGGAGDGRTDQTDPGAYNDDDIPF